MSDGPAGTDSIEAAAAITPDFLGGQKLQDGIGLCLSGGGFRAMLFHLGAFVRLNSRRCGAACEQGPDTG